MGKVIKLYCAEHAWNIDGSSGDQRLDQYGNKISWIKYWENKTGIKRSVCSYSDCNQDAICGGHIWVKKVGVVIAPICNECNHISNLDRQQNILLITFILFFYNINVIRRIFFMFQLLFLHLL